MKHVFLTPNPISYFVAEAVIDDQGLNSADTHVLYTRNFAPRSAETRVERLPFGWDDFPYTKRLWKAWTTMYRFDQWVNQQVGAPFSLYLPHEGMPQYQLLKTHSLCRKVSYIEEGKIAYLDQNELNSLQRHSMKARDKVVSKFGYFDRWLRGAARFPDRNARVFGCFPETFPWSSNKTLVRYRANSRHPDAYRNIEAVLALRPMLSNFWTEELLSECLHRLATWATYRGIGSFALKVHPGGFESAELVSITKSVLSSYDLFGSVLPHSFYLEEYLVSSDSLVITMGSSVDLYSVALPGRLLFLGAFASRARQVLNEYICDQPTAVRSYYSFVAKTSRQEAETIRK